MADSAQRQGAPHVTLPLRRPFPRDLMVVVPLAVFAHFVLVLPAPLVVRAVVALGFLMLPGYVAATLLLRGKTASWLDRATLTIGLGLAILLLVGLALVYIPGPLTQPLVWLGFDLVLAALIVVSSQRSDVSSQRSDVSSQRSDVSSQRSDVSSQRSVASSQRSVASSQRSVVSSQKAESRQQEAESQKQEADGNHQSSIIHHQSSIVSLQSSVFSLQSSVFNHQSSIIFLAVLLAAVFRLTHLGYAEFQGDEARAMLMAAGLGQGRDEVLFVHKKGPGEVLAPALMWAATGGIDEATARLPFALAGLGGVLAVGALALNILSTPGPRGEPRLGGGGGVIAALVVAVILALDGYFIAFGRIVQYQSIVALMSILGVWCAWSFYRSGHTRWVMLGAGLIAVGTLGHYEAIFALPPFAFLVTRRSLTRPLTLPAFRPLVGAGLVFTAVAAFFYLPFALHPHFTETVRYILDRRISGGGAGGGPLYNNLADYFTRATFYNSTWYILSLALAWGMVLGWAGWIGWRVPASSEKNEAASSDWVKRLGPWLALGWPAFAVLLAAVSPSMLTVGRLTLAILLFLPILLWLLLPRLSDGFKMALLWFLGPFLVAAFLVQKPHTHFYTMMPGLALLVGWGVYSYIGRQGDREAGRQGDREARRQRGRETGRQGDREAGIEEEGKKEIGLSREAEMAPSASTSLPPGSLPPSAPVSLSPSVPASLSPSVPVSLSPCLPVSLFTYLPVYLFTCLLLLFSGYQWMVFVRHEPEYKRVYPAARSPLYPVVYGDQPPRGGYFGFPYRAGWGVVAALYADGTLQGDYDSNEELLITGWYTRGAARCVGNPRYYLIAENVQDEERVPFGRIEKEYHLMAIVEVEGRPKLRIFSREPVAQVQRYTLADSVRLNPTQGVDFPIGQALAEAVPATPTDVAFSVIRLLGYEVSTTSVTPGEWVNLTLFWQADARPDSDLTVFTHIEDSRIWGQNDGWPQCGQRPTSKWQPGEVIVETRSLRLDPTTPAGEYPIRVGLYNVSTGQRVPAQGTPAESDHAILGTVTVRP